MPLKAFFIPVPLFLLFLVLWKWCGWAERKYTVKRRFNSSNLNIGPQIRFLWSDSVVSVPVLRGIPLEILDGEPWKKIIPHFASS